MVKLKPIKAVSFDFFGTLVDYQDTYNTSLQPLIDLFRENKIPVREKELQDTINKAFGELEKKAGENMEEYSMIDVMEQVFMVFNINANSKLITKAIDLYLKEWSKYVIYDKEVSGLLKDIAEKYKVAIVTNTHHAPLVEYHIKAAGIGISSYPIITSVEFGRRKPCPTIFHHTAKLLKVSPQEVLLIGDSLVSDYHGAIKAGMQAILLDKKGKNKDVRSIFSLHDLRKILL